MRRTASYVRGDYTGDDKVDMHRMAKLSIGNKGLNYGISIDEIFWVQHGIITKKNIRESRDEELIAKLYHCMIVEQGASITADTLNRLYTEGTKVHQKVKDVLVDSNVAYEEKFSSCYSRICDILEAAGQTFSQLLFKGDAYNRDYAFLIVFLALYGLMKQGWEIKDYSDIAKRLTNAGNTELSEIISKKDCPYERELRIRLIERIQSLMKKSMYMEGTDSLNKERNVWLENTLLLAKSESQMCDFKIGMTTLKTGVFNEDCIHKIAKTLVAMVNTYPGKEGSIIIGVADKESDAVDHKRHYGSDFLKCAGYCVTGVQDEATKYYGGIDNYEHKLKAALQREPISECLKQSIGTNSGVCQFHDKVILVLTAKAENPEYYSGELYVRDFTDNKKLGSGSVEFQNVQKSFYLREHQEIMD